MTRRLPAALTLLGLLVALGAALTAAAGGSDVLLDALLQRPHEQSGTRVVPDRFLRRWDPLTVFFAAPKGKTGPEDHPERLVELSPAHPGAWTWLDAKTLQFRPAEPWTPMSAVGLTVEKRTTEVFTLAPPPRSTSPRSGARDLEPLDAIQLTFDDPLPPETLARLTRIELRPLPGLSDDGLVVLDSDDFEVKTLQRSDDDQPVTYALVLTEPIGRGLQARVKIGLSLDTDAREAVHELVFSTSEPFRAVQMGCNGSQVPIASSGSRYAADQPLACTGDRQLVVRFNANPSGLGPVEGRNLVRFEPAVEGLSFEQYGRELHVRGAFREGVRYRMQLVPTPVLDTAGRPLEMTGTSEVHFRFDRREPYFKWGAGQGIVERYGPKRVPIEGRGVGQVDVRVYEVDPRNRELWPFPAGPIAVDERTRPPGPGEEPAPLAETGTVGVQDLRARLKALGSPGFSALVDVGLEGSAARSGLDLDAPLKTLSGTSGAGHYLVGVRRVDGAAERHWMRVQVTDLALTTLETGDQVRFFVTSLSSGKPVSGAKIEVEGVVSDSSGSHWRTLINGTTDAAGGFGWTAPGSGSVSVRRIVVAKSDDTLVLDATKPPDSFADGHWQGGGGTWLQWAWQGLSGRVESTQMLAHVFTERPMYRPEEDVHLKGYVRNRLKGELTAVTGKGELIVRAPGGANWRLPVTLSKSGSFYAKWSEADIPTGRYTVQYQHEKGGVVASTDFQVEAYRLPTFEVDLTTAGNTTTVPNDQPFDVKATASYYAGGKVALRPIQWSVTQFPYAWDPEGLEGFLYSSDGRFGRSGRFDSTPALQREGQTDRAGAASLTLDPGIEPTSQPRTYVIEAMVTGADEQTVTATHRVNAVPAFVLGLKVPRHLEKADKIPVQAVSVGPDGKLVAGTDVTVRLVQRQWHSVLQASDFSDGIARYVTDTVDVPLKEQRIQTGASPTSLDLAIDEPGVYLVELEARDALGRAQVVSVDLYAGGTGNVSWTKPEAGVFDVTADQDRYRPGQTAKLVIRSPFQTGSALVVVEGPKGNDYKSVAILGGKATVPVKIEEGWVPRIPVHVLLRRGRVDDAGAVAGMDLGKPETVGNTHWLTIEPVENTVSVELAHPERATPGEQVDVTVTLADPDGKPLSGEVTLWLVDQAVLALATEKRLDPLPDFIPNRQSRFSARDTRNLAFGTLPFSEMPGGDGGDEEDAADDVLEKTSVRKNFKSVPYYEPAIQVGPTGKTTVKVQLPDNLTVFKIRAKATSGTERFGSAKSQIRVRLPVLVQPDLPRFVRPGDALEVAALGRVVEGDAGAGSAQVKVEGLKLGAADKSTFAWDADEAVRIAWPVTVPTPPPTAEGALSRNSVTVTIGAKRSSDGAGDAVEITLPLLDDRRARTERALIEVAAGKVGQLEAIEEPARPGSLLRNVVVSDHPGIVKMAAGMDVFVRRPSQSTGQQIDRGRAWIGLGDLRESLGLEGKELVDAAVAEGLAWLPGVVDGRGLVAAWPGGRGSITLTADALLFLEDAKESGYTVDEKLRAQLIRSLEAGLRSDYRYFLDGSSWYERTRALEALASAGAWQEPYFTELADNSRYLGPDGMAYTLMASSRAGRSDSALAKSLAGKLEDEVVLALFEGEERYRGLKTGRSALSAQILSSEAATVATMTRSLQRAQPKSEKLPYLFDALVRLGGEDGWGSRADAPALLAIAERMRSRTAPRVEVTVGGAALRTDKGVGRIAVADGGALEVRHTDGPAGIVYASSRYIPAQAGSEADARNRGFVMSRDHALYVEGSSTPTRVALDEGGRELKLTLGQIVEDHVQLVNPEDRTYVAIEVPLAAGVELMNPNLKTSGTDATPSKTNTRAATWTKLGDASVTYYFEALPKGTYDFYFRTRATTRGRFVQPPAIGELLYDESITGASPGAWVVVK
ncbi:MAG: alpha-2-macroglobulin family protein [Myxococcota bacterium]